MFEIKLKGYGIKKKRKSEVKLNGCRKIYPRAGKADQIKDKLTTKKYEDPFKDGR